MTQQSTERLLCVGGPRDGRTVEVYPGLPQYRVPLQVETTHRDGAVSNVRNHTYRREVFVNREQRRRIEVFVSQELTREDVIARLDRMD